MLRGVIKTVALALVGCSFASAQEAPKWESRPKTKLETFLGTSGAVIIRGFTEIGTVGGKGAARVLAVMLRNATIGEEVKGIVIEVSQPAPGSRTAARSFVDYDEIAGLIQGIDHVVKVDRSATELAGVEATYTTRGDVAVVVFLDKAGRQQASVRVGPIGARSTSMGMEQLAEFRRLIVLAKGHLDNPQAAAAERAAANARAARAAAARAARDAAASSSAQLPGVGIPPSSSPSEKDPIAAPDGR